MGEHSTMSSFDIEPLLNNVREGLQSGEWQTFSNFKTDRERISFLFEHKSIQDGMPNITCMREKLESVAQKSRQTGNEFFKKKDYNSAMMKYTESIRHGHSPAVPVSNGNQAVSELAYAYGNRSAVLFHKMYFRECVRDIDRAFLLGYPDKMKYKLLDRKGKALLKEMRIEDAKDCFQKAMENISKVDVDEKTRNNWSTLLEKQVQAIDCMKRQEKSHTNNNVDKSEILDLTAGNHENKKSRSKLLAIKNSDAAGRFFVAQDDISVGDVLIKESPFISVLEKHAFLSHCQNCNKKVIAPVPCTQCSEVVFCQESCREEATEWFHNYECGYLGVLHTFENAKLWSQAMRLILKVKPAEMMARFGVKPEETMARFGEKLNLGNSCLGSDYRDICNLVTNNNQRSANNLFGLAWQACFLSKILLKMHYPALTIDGVFALEMQIALAVAAMHHLQTVECNSYAITEFNNSKNVTECKPREIAQGVFPEQAMMNHSCDPGVEVCFYGNVLVTRAIKNIKAGTEVCVDYGPIFISIPKPQRQDILKLHYFFSCQCPPCRYNWPLWEDVESKVPTFLCQNCNAALKETLQKPKGWCSACDTQNNLSHMIQTLSSSYQEYAKVMTKLKTSTSDLEECLKILSKHLTIMQDTICPPWAEFLTCQAAIRQIFRIMSAK